MHGSVEVAAERQCEERCDGFRTHSRSACRATFLSGILAGGAVDRVIVGGPAWHALGAPAWAQYSRLADLGSGLVAYPIEGIGSALLIIAAAISSHFDRAAARAVWLPLYFAVAFSVIGLLLTVKAAPITLGPSGVAIAGCHWTRVRRILLLGTLSSGFCRCPSVRGLGLDVH